MAVSRGVGIIEWEDRVGLDVSRVVAIQRRDWDSPKVQFLRDEMFEATIAMC